VKIATAIRDNCLCPCEIDAPTDDLDRFSVPVQAAVGIDAQAIRF
jgi:hypothetical protein